MLFGEVWRSSLRRRCFRTCSEPMNCRSMTILQLIIVSDFPFFGVDCFVWGVLRLGEWVCDDVVVVVVVATMVVRLVLKRRFCDLVDWRGFWQLGSS